MTQCEPDDSDSDESDEEESDDTEATEESGFLYDEEGRKIDIKQFYEAIRRRKKRTAKGDDEIPFKVVRGPRGHRGSKGRKRTSRGSNNISKLGKISRCQCNNRYSRFRKDF